MIFSSLLLCALRLGSPGTSTATGTLPAMPGADGPGFTSAIFSKSVLNDLLSDRDCAGIRFYNVMINGQGTLMAIGMRADSSDINGGLFASPYKANLPTTEDPMRITGLGRGAAKDACEGMAGAGYTSFSAFASGRDVQELLALEGCEGLQAVPASGSGTTAIMITAVRMDGSNTVPLGSGGMYERSTAEPCPNSCGPESQYARYINADLLPVQNK